MARPELTLALRLEPSGRSTGPTLAALIPWNQVPWLQRLCYALPTSALRAYRVAALERGVLVRASEVLEGIPFGTLVRARRAGCAGPGRDAAGAGGVARPCWPIGWAPSGGPPSCFPTAPGAPFRVPADALVALELRVLGALTPAPAGQSAAFPRQEPIAEPVEIENRPMGPMPLWGLRRSNPPG